MTRDDLQVCTTVFTYLGQIADFRQAMPHDEVETSEFYKHIESEGLSEPRRMKQLLTWCATRALGEKPLFSAEDSNARLAGMLVSIVHEHWVDNRAAREIQNQLLKAFSKRSELSDWFNRVRYMLLFRSVIHG